MTFEERERETIRRLREAQSRRQSRDEFSAELFNALDNFGAEVHPEEIVVIVEEATL